MDNSKWRFSIYSHCTCLHTYMCTYTLAHMRIYVHTPTYIQIWAIFNYLIRSQFSSCQCDWAVVAYVEFGPDWTVIVHLKPTWNQYLTCELLNHCWMNHRMPGMWFRSAWWKFKREKQWLTHWGREKMTAISQTTHPNAFSWMKMYEFRLKFHWRLFLGVELTIFHHWFR